MKVDFTSTHMLFATTVGINDEVIQRKVIPQIMTYTNVLNSRPSSNFPGIVRPSEKHGLGVFASRDIRKGEIFSVSMKETSDILIRVNDAANFPECLAVDISLEDMRNYYRIEGMKYTSQSRLNANIKGVILDDESTGDRMATFVILKDVKRNEELLRSYGIVGWMAGNIQRLRSPCWNYAVYEQWSREAFPALWEQATEPERVEAMHMFATQFMLHQIELMNQRG
jgi:hypothetical protein